MKDILFYATLILFSIWSIRNTLFWLHLWQIKEYRFDRLLIHVRETIQGKNLLVGPGSLFKTAIFLGLLYYVFFSESSIYLDIAVFFLYLFSAITVAIEVFYRKIRIPTFTIKIGIILLLSLVAQVVLVSFPLVERSFWIIVVDRLIPIMVALLMGIFWLPAEFYKDYYVSQATRKRGTFSKLQVIGITGSYGKGSTKEYLYSVLAERFNVEKTFGTFNTPIGIARTILNRITNKTQIFIAEMGAYKIGEVEEMCQIAQPVIGILTAVNDQHVSLFGSIQNTMKAKYEIITNLPKNGMGLFNGNNEIVRKLHKGTKKRKAILYYADYENKGDVDADIVAHNIKVDRLHVTFEVRLKGTAQGAKMKVNLVGRHIVENILPSIYLGFYFGMNVREIHKALLSIKPAPKTMEPLYGAHGSLYIDDTFNANPQAVLAAVEYMKIFPGKKILILQPMIELGKHGSEHHEQVAEEAGKVCDVLLLTNNNFFQAIEKGIEKSRNQCEVSVKSPREIADFIKSNLKEGDIAVFEGKEAGIGLHLLQYEKAY
jgi:UDP-N-acetylmuramoyl-tripeptide--D-alanyl-D-alanine ligase